MTATVTLVLEVEDEAHADELVAEAKQDPRYVRSEIDCGSDDAE